MWEQEKRPATSWFQRAILSNKKLGDELIVAFGLIVVTVLVLLGYLFPGVSSFFGSREMLPAVLLIAAVIILMGVLIIIHIIGPIIRISKEAERIAKGDLSREIQVAREDEVGELGASINQMTQKIKEHVEELRSLSETTASLKAEVESRIIVLSQLMEISNKIAQNAPMSEVLDIVVNKCLGAYELDFGCLILKNPLTKEYKVHYLGGLHKDALRQKGIDQLSIELGAGLLGKAILQQEAVIVDEKTPLDKEVEEFRSNFLLKNAIIAPVSSKGRAYGLLIAGNDKPNFMVRDSSKELLQLIAKHVSIAVLNDLLMGEIRKLEMTDTLTGLPNNAFARRKLQAEIDTARNFQRSCSFVLLRLDRFSEIKDMLDHIDREDIVLKVAAAVQEGIQDAESVARFAENEFCLILPQISKKEAIERAERIIRQVPKALQDQKKERKQVTCSAAVVENPIDGNSADELILKSGIILSDTEEQGGNKVGY